MTLPMRLHIYSNNDPVFYKSQVAPKISSIQKSKPLQRKSSSGFLDKKKTKIRLLLV